MKKIYVLLISGLFLSSTNAQTLTATGSNPVIGQTYDRVITGAFSQGSSGTSQTWNISSLTGSNSSATVVSVGSTPNGSNHPNSNISILEGTSYNYLKTSSSALQIQGIEIPSISFIYSNPEDMLRFPFSYTNTYTDTWSATFTSGVFFTRKGSTTNTADGTGTLITPSGTYTNVIRIHSVQNYSDSADLGGIPYIITYTNDQYFWYRDGIHFPLASTYNLISSATSPTTGGYFTDIQVGIPENEYLAKNLSVIPNPTRNNVSVNYSLEKASQVTISIINTIGDEVFINQSTENSIGNHLLNVDISNLVKGIYFVRIVADEKSATKKLIVQ